MEWNFLVELLMNELISCKPYVDAVFCPMTWQHLSRPSPCDLQNSKRLVGGWPVKLLLAIKSIKSHESEKRDSE